jgi:hypothetical protein
MDFDSVEEAAGAVQELLMDAVEGAETSADEMDAESMWNEEAAARPPQRGLMA